VPRFKEQRKLPKNGYYIFIGEHLDRKSLLYIYPSQTESVYVNRVCGTITPENKVHGVWKDKRFEVLLKDDSESRWEQTQAASNKFKIGLMLLAGYLIPKLNAPIDEAGVIINNNSIVNNKRAEIFAYAIAHVKCALAFGGFNRRARKAEIGRHVEIAFGKAFRHGNDKLLVVKDGTWILRANGKLEFTELITISDAIVLPELFGQFAELS